MKNLVLWILFIAFVIVSAQAVDMSEYTIALVFGVLAALCGLGLASGKKKDNEAAWFNARSGRR